jgi:hypothetical protein
MLKTRNMAPILHEKRRHFLKVLVQIPYSQHIKGGLNVKNHHLYVKTALGPMSHSSLHINSPWAYMSCF